MSDEEEFQSAQKECSLQIVNINSFKSHSLSPNKTVKQHGINWKFQKIKNLAPTSVSSRKQDNKNISFQTDDMVQLSDQDNDSEKQERFSSFTKAYRNCQRVYQKQRNMGTNWLGNLQYFSSVFIEPNSLSKSEGNIFKPSGFKKPSKKSECYFDSDFESGNLYTAYKIGKNQYDLILQNDINTKGNTQWFYFRITNIPAKTKIKLNIINMLKCDSLFNYGMQPCVFSTEGSKKNAQGWIRTGSSIKYSRNQLKVQGSRRFYHTLTFTISTPYEGDVLKVAQCYPYSLQQLQYFLDIIEKKYSKRNLIKRQVLGETIAKNKIQAIKITQENPRKKDSKPIIIVTARQHPGQTPGSYVCEGFVQFLLSEEKQALFLRKNYEIIVIPMLNPDGVMVGNYRTNLSGLDLNRRWDGSKSKQASELQIVKRYIIASSKNKQIAFILDLHGHSRKLFSFFYGNIGEVPESVRLFPYLCSKISSNMIRFQDCTFNCEQSKIKTARVQFNLKYKVPNIFTFETSFFGYIGKDRQKVHFNQQKFKNLGQILAKGIFFYEKYKKFPQSPEALVIRKFHDELKNRPQLIKYGEKICSGSESQPEQCEVGQCEYQKLRQSQQFSKQLRDNKKKKLSKKEIMIKQISKPSRQLHVMDIARVNSIFPNDVLALMPSSFGQKEKKKERTIKNTINAMIQTLDVPFIKIYDICKISQMQEERRQPIKNESLVEKQNKSNLFRSVMRPKSSSNAYLQLPPNISPNKRQIRKRHESGVQTKLRDKKGGKKVNVFVQTIITFHPEMNLEESERLETIINPIPVGLESLRRRTHFSTIDPDTSESNKRSSQSFKIGLRALNIETWRIKKKNFQ